MMSRIGSAILVFISLILIVGASYAVETRQVVQQIEQKMTPNIIVKSPSDKKQYRYLELDNRLNVLLISDHETDKSAAALDVYVGSGSDPDDWQGLAHFLEHMLFLGTKKYPAAEEYQAFIKNNGGSYNAFTSFSHTNYYFSIAADQIEPALDRFSRFFIDPTFDKAYVDRERSIIHSEYQARKKNESRRLWDAQKKWLNQAHPSSRFSVGSLESLRDREDASARETLITFYNQHYSANIMSLVVIGRESLDQLEQMVSARFSQIPDRNTAIQLFAQQYMDSDAMPARLNSVPEKELNAVRFVFPMPSVYEEYRSKPLSYIANLLGHEGQGSLYALLKELGWATSLSAGAGYMDQVQGEFSIQISLTKQGLKHIEDIGELVFQAINLIKQQNIAEWRFQEQSNLAEIAFRFQPKSNAGQLVQSLAHKLQRYPAKDVLRGAYLMDLFAPTRIKTLLGYLNPNNVNVHVTAQSLPTDKISRYYDVKYSLTAIEADTLKRWQTKRIHSNLKLPAENPFIPERLAEQSNVLEMEVQQNKPKQISERAGIAIWYQPDYEFAAPKANFYFSIKSPLVNNDAKNWVLTELYVRLVNSQLTKATYPAYLADLNYSLYRHARGISVRISGFEDKQSALLNLIIEALANPEYDEDRFRVIKDGLLRELGNMAKDAPSDQVVREIYRRLMQPYWSAQEQIAVLKSMSVDDVEKFVAEFFNYIDVSILSHGDVSRNNTIVRSAMLDRLLKNRIFIPHVKKPIIHKMERSLSQIVELKIAHQDSAVAYYFQGRDDSTTERATLSLLKHLMAPYFYNQLRTVNHVGYLVNISVLTMYQMSGLLLLAQSTEYFPIKIAELYQAFLTDFGNRLDEMSAAKFEQLKSVLAANVLNKDNNLSERSQRYWREIDREEYQFDSQQQFSDAVTQLTLKEIQQYYKKNVDSYPSLLIVQSVGKKALTKEELEFKRDLEKKRYKRN